MHSVSQFIEKLDQDKDSKNVVDINSGIVSFADGKAQERIFEYVNLILNSTKKHKLNKIKEANEAYILKYGQNNLMINNQD